MVGGFLNDIIKKMRGEVPVSPDLAKQFSELSFVPPPVKREEVAPLPRGPHEKCALVGVTLGVIALLSWVVIAIGVFVAIVGIIFSVIGLKSAHPKWARAGLVLSILGLIASLWYVMAAYSGKVNYNYFTSEFWTSSTTTVK